jgi:hypothetical protein
MACENSQKRVVSSLNKAAMLASSRHKDSASYCEDGRHRPFEFYVRELQGKTPSNAKERAEETARRCVLPALHGQSAAA